MTRIDFHVNVSNKLDYACRVVRKAYAAQQNVVVHCANETERKKLDSLLWTFSPLDFIPHSMVENAEIPAPVWLMQAESSLSDKVERKILLNLSAEVPAQFSQFERLIEIADAREEDLQAARVRWRHYKERGYPLSMHESNK